MIRAALSLAAVAVALLALAACGGSSQPGLPGTSWVLTSLDGSDPVAGAVPTLGFSTDGRLGGSSGCNQYGGDVTLGDGEITVGPIQATRMACDEPRMAQEAAYLEALQGATGYTSDGATLEIVSPDATLTFTAA